MSKGNKLTLAPDPPCDMTYEELMQEFREILADEHFMELFVEKWKAVRSYDF